MTAQKLRQMRICDT